MNHLTLFSYFLAASILLSINPVNNVYAHHIEDKAMFKNQMNIRPVKPKTLENVNFIDKNNIEKVIDELANSSKDPYSASLSMIASAEMGDTKRYEFSRSQLLGKLAELEKHPESAPQWMQNNSFKAWMWGRILLAADSVNDTNTVMEAKEKLQSFLNENITSGDNPAFITWAWGYRAAYDQNEYEISKKRMLDDALKLNAKFKDTAEHAALSDALWAWVMNLQAAAYAGDKTSYKWIKEQIKSIAETESVTQALEKGLLRTAQSNDYPAWAMAKVRCAAIVAEDKELYQEIEKSLTLSIDNAQKENAKAEYVLSVLDNQLAIYTEQNFKNENKSGLTR